MPNLINVPISHLGYESGICLNENCSSARDVQCHWRFKNCHSFKDNNYRVFVTEVSRIVTSDSVSIQYSELCTNVLSFACVALAYAQYQLHIFFQYEVQFSFFLCCILAIVEQAWCTGNTCNKRSILSWLWRWKVLYNNCYYSTYFFRFDSWASVYHPRRQACGHAGPLHIHGWSGSSLLLHGLVYAHDDIWRYDR